MAVGKEPGQASAIKLILSISTKGLEALLVEMLLAAHHYGGARFGHPADLEDRDRALAGSSRGGCGPSLAQSIHEEERREGRWQH